MNSIAKRWALGLMPLALLAALGTVVSQTGILDVVRGGAPPVEELTFDRVTLSPNEITLEVINGGPDPVTIAQVMVDEAFWTFRIEPASGTIGRLGRATVRVPYPWVEDEAHEVVLLSSTGVTFAHEIEVARETPSLDAGYFGLFALIGLYVGVIPVLIGLMWLPFLKSLDRKWIHFALALTAGLLVFLGADALSEALEAGGEVAGAYQGTLIVVVGVIGTLLLLQSVSSRRVARSGEAGRRTVALLIALGIGLHNLGEGLAIGAAYALGEVTLGAFLIIGFMMHNTTEGLGIVAPIARDKPSLRTLAGLGLLAGAPTVLGAWIGGAAYSPLLATLFLSIGVGAIIQVVLVLYRVMVSDVGAEHVWNPLTAGGMFAGLAVMYATGLLVA